MHYSSDWCRVDKTWKDVWVCYGCSNNVDGDLLRKFVGQVCPAEYMTGCSRCDFMSLVIDCGNPKYLVLGERVCTRHFSSSAFNG